MKKQLLVLLMLSLIGAPTYAMKEDTGEKDTAELDKYCIPYKACSLIAPVATLIGLVAHGALLCKRKSIQKKFAMLQKHAELNNQDLINQLMAEYNISSLDKLKLNEALKKATKHYNTWIRITGIVGYGSLLAFILTCGCCCIGCDDRVINCIDTTGQSVFGGEEEKE